jgi:predicted MFS family arabinose efflux permease
VKQKIVMPAWFLQGTAFLSISFLGHMANGTAALLFSIPIGFGMGLLLPMFFSISQEMANDSNRASSGGMVQLSRNLGGAMGVSLLGVWISGGLTIETGLQGIFISLAVVGYAALIFTGMAGKRKKYGNLINEAEEIP